MLTDLASIFILVFAVYDIFLFFDITLALIGNFVIKKFVNVL